MYIKPYSVQITDFAQRHYIKSFIKKYSPKQWDITITAIRSLLSRYDNFVINRLSTISQLDYICECGSCSIIKLDFAIAGTNTSPKSSGNRIIAAVDVENKSIQILLVYSKNDINTRNETIAWKQIISAQYTEFSDL